MTERSQETGCTTTRLGWLRALPARWRDARGVPPLVFAIILPVMLGLYLSTAVTTKAYAQRKGWQLEGVSVELEMERIKREDYPAYTGDAPFVHEIRERIHFAGPLSEEQRARLLTIAGKCPVHLTLANPVFFVQQVVEPQTPV